MKRSTSCSKKALLKPGDGTQQKISSFFQPGPAQAPSKLFTNINATKSKPALSLKRPVNTSKSNTTTASNSKSNTTTASNSEQNRHADSTRKSMTVLKDFNCATTQHETPQKSASLDLSEEGSPEVVVIPDTPENKHQKSWPKPVSRSFLCSVSQLSTMPGKKLSPPKTKQRKAVKKPLGPVSVEFGKKRLSDHEKAESNANENSLQALEEFASNCSADASSESCPQTNSGPNELVLEKTSDICDSNAKSESIKQQENNSDLSSSSKCSVQPMTPTKPSSDRNTAKRMAVQGLSPDPKRLQGDETMTSDDMQSSKVTTSRCKVKAKRQLADLTGFKNVRDMNHTVNHYQLGGSTKAMAKTDSSCVKDDVLADILGEMADAPAQQNIPVKKACGTVTKRNQVSPIKVDNCLKTQSLEMVPAADTAEDDVLKEILGELDSKLCQNQNHRTNIPQCRTKIGDRGNNSVTKKSGNKTKENFKPCIPQSEDGDGTSTLPQTDQQSQDKNKTKYVSSSGNEGSSGLKSVADVQQTKCAPEKKRREPYHAQVRDPVNRELASSFGHLSPFKNAASASSSNTISKEDYSLKFTDKWNRYKVHSVTTDRNTHDKVLQLSKEGTTETTKTARLQGFWSDTHVEPGNIVHLLLEDQEHVCGKGDSNGNDACPIIIDDNRGQIVVSPDLLLSGTTIVSGVYCLRRSILNEKFKGVDSKNVHMLYGSIIHSLFQEVLKDRLTRTEEIMTAAKSVVQSNKFLHDMYGQCVSEAKVMEEIEAYVGPLQAWLHKHVPSVSQRNTDRAGGDVSVVQIHDIEETIWSPRIGVKGKIDMTVEVEVQNGGARKRKVLPLELKTGKASYSVEHKGQVTLYSMMMCDRRQNPEEGLLLYLKHNDMNTIPVKPENTRGLIQLRNEMAYYLSRQAEAARDEEGNVSHHRLGPLPSPINSRRSCSKCPQLINCAVYQRNVENLQHGPDHAMTSLVPEALSHLSESHLSYFRHWLLCMDLETATQHADGLRNIWCMSSAEREETGDCLQQLVMVNSTLGVPETQAFMEGKGCCVQFQRKPGFSGGPLNTAGLSKNDAVVISSENGRYIALSTGFIKNVTETVVDVVVDRDSFHENAAFQSLVFRIDRCDVFNTAGYLLTNLSRLLDSSAHCHKLRSLIIDGRKPEFQLTMSKSAVEKVKKIFRPLNKPQKTAILKVLMSKDYVLIKGYPGTGKTSTIVALVKILRELGQSVLLTSYTHSAVDNILLKLKKDGVPFLRLGRSSRIHPQVQDHAAETLTLDIMSVDELREFYSSYGVVATSCLGVNHPLFAQRRFDVCIVDEASQVLQPACLGPLFHADRFVLVGDPRQLPPVVQSKEASSLGMGESLFAHLDGAGATYDLHLQYRMNSTIMQLSNELVYKGALTCGDSVISAACIQPSDLSLGDDVGWLHRALDTSLPNAVVFLDTCQIHAPETCDTKGLSNEMEASLILRLCTAFVQAGVSASDIGVIAPYRAQVRALQQRLSEWCPLKGVEVNTVDQYQGRDKSVVFISFVRSTSHVDSESGHRRGLLQDVRRLNVAVTRAKHKLVLVGNSSSLRHYEPLDALLMNLRSRHQIYSLPADLRLEEFMDL